MIERREIAALVKSVGAIVREVADTLARRIDALEKRFAEIPAGPRGEKGDRGDDGCPGEQGPIGDRGDKGDPGERGPQGIPGEKGDPGEKGLSIIGERGIDGKDGKDGRDGRDGKDGLSGKDGRDGIDGRDALDLQPLDAIDESRSYPRGTWACHKGGLVRFDGHQWKCMVRGISHESDELSADFRTRIRKTFYTDGTVYEVSTVSPAMIYREIFKDGTEYTRGDCVTYDRSVWICVVESTKARPDTGPEWKLAVRKGGEGRPGKDGAPGINGKDGKDGRLMGAPH